MKIYSRFKYFIILKILFIASSGIVSLYSAPAYAVQEGPQENNPQKPPSNQQNFTLQASLELGDGRKVSGKIKFNAPDKLIIRHVKNDIPYTKEVLIQNFSEIELLKWKGMHQRKTKEGEVYKFNVNSFSLKLKNGSSYVINENLFPFLENLQIENSNGQVSLFTYWIDLVKPDGSWYTGMSGPVTGNRIICHKDVVKKISFISEE